MGDFIVLKHQRVQHAVGQGFFHTAELNEEGSSFRYVFDCGAMSAYKAARSARIDAYRKSLPLGTQLDLVFISHAHADHLNGLEQLLKPGVTVDTIVLPLMNDTDRLIAFGRDVMEDAASAQDGFYRDFIANPVAALGRFNPRQIVFVRAQHGDGGAPGSDGDGFDGPDGDGDIGVPPRDSRLAWKLVGRPSRGTSAAQHANKLDGPAVEVINDTQALAVPLKSPMFWLLAPYVDPTIEADRKIFIKALASKLRASGAKSLAANINHLSVADLQKVIKQYTAVLAASYAEINKNLNVTSLCLYSGPASQGLPPTISYQAKFGKWQTGEMQPARVAWLTTGDAALKETKRRKPFLRHFGKLLKQVVTLTLPHHGSERNFDRELITEIDPLLFVVSADHYGKWRHPSSAVLQEVASGGGVVSVVTSNVLSTVFEEAILT